MHPRMARAARANDFDMAMLDWWFIAPPSVVRLCLGTRTACALHAHGTDSAAHSLHALHAHCTRTAQARSFGAIHDRFGEYSRALKRSYPLLPEEGHYFWAYHIRHVLSAGRVAADPLSDSATSASATSATATSATSTSTSTSAVVAAAAAAAEQSRFEWRFLPSMVEGADFRLARQWMSAPCPPSPLHPETATLHDPDRNLVYPGCNPMQSRYGPHCRLSLASAMPAEARPPTDLARFPDDLARSPDDLELGLGLNLSRWMRGAASPAEQRGRSVEASPSVPPG